MASRESGSAGPLEDIALANGERYELDEMSQAMVTLRVSDTMALIASRLAGSGPGIEPCSSSRTKASCAQATLSSRPIVARPGEEWFARVSIGTAAFPQHGRSLEGLMAASDEQMYRDKHQPKQLRTRPPKPSAQMIH